MGTWTTPAADACDENEDRAVHVATDPYRYVFRTADRETVTVPVRMMELSIMEVMWLAVYLVVMDRKKDIWIVLHVSFNIPIVPAAVSWILEHLDNLCHFLKASLVETDVTITE
jgi:hypothetical protein